MTTFCWYPTEFPREDAPLPSTLQAPTPLLPIWTVQANSHQLRVGLVFEATRAFITCELAGIPRGCAHRVRDCGHVSLLFISQRVALVSRANHVLRVVHPENSCQFAIHHDAGIHKCLDNLLHILVNRRLEVVADGLLLFHGPQLAVDTTKLN